MAQELVTFADIIAAVREEVGIQPNDDTAIDRIKRNINIVYLDKVVPKKRWFWLQKETAQIYKQAYTTGTATVTNGSTTVTLSGAPTSTVGDSGSFLNYRAQLNNFDEIYKVSAHTALATGVTLSSAYQGATSSSASVKFWREVLDLPVDARETVQVWHDRYSRSMTAAGVQELNEIKMQMRGREGFPLWYSTRDFSWPSGSNESTSNRFRQVEVFPAVNTSSNVTIKMIYTQVVTPLVNDEDEPLMPLEDRIILLYGALERAWIGIANNPEESIRNKQLFDEKLSEMAARVGDSFDTPKIQPSLMYTKLPRMRTRRRWRDW